MDVPQLLIEGHYSEQDLDQLRKTVPIWRTTDILESQLAALFDVRHPTSANEPDYVFKKVKFLRAHGAAQKMVSGNWIYFPWDRHLIHTVNRSQFYELMFRTNPSGVRPSQQKTLLNAKIAIIGLRWGGDMAVALAHSGIGRHFVLADPTFSTNWSISDNLWSHSKLGLFPMEAVCRQLFDINPYLEIDTFETDMDAYSITRIAGNARKPQVIIDLEADPQVKIEIRKTAQSLQIPVISVLTTSTGYQFTEDRFDLNQTAPYFRGKFGATAADILSHPGYQTAITISPRTAESMHLAHECIQTVTAAILGSPIIASASRPLVMKRSTLTRSK